MHASEPWIRNNGDHDHYAEALGSRDRISAFVQPHITGRHFTIFSEKLYAQQSQRITAEKYYLISRLFGK